MFFVDVELQLSGFFDKITERFDGIPRFRLFIDGRWIESTDKTYFELHTPIDGTLLAYVSRAPAEDVERAVATAKNSSGR